MFTLMQLEADSLFSPLPWLQPREGGGWGGIPDESLRNSERGERG